MSMNIDQKFRVEKLNREIAECRRVLASKSKPPQRINPQPVGFDRPDFADRVFARLDNQQSIPSKIRTTPRAFVSARETVREMVRSLMETKGMDRRRAMVQIAKDRPDLLEAMKDEANPGRKTNRWRR